MNVSHVTTLPPWSPRPEDAHKGTFGRVLILAGSRGMSGAACLSGLGALRGGAGLVYVGVPEGILDIVASVEPSYLTIPLPEDAEGRISLKAIPTLEKILPANTAVAMGPGWGRSDDLVELVQWLYSSLDCPAVVDADALNALSECREIPKPKGPRILTPHPGEFARLLKTDIGKVQENREELAAEFADRHGVIVVLKGHRTIVTDGARVAVNPTGNSGMATGGTGDVLTGLIASLLAQRMAPFEAAQLGAYVHGHAGDIAAEQLSPEGLIASDLPHYIGKAWKALKA